VYWLTNIPTFSFVEGCVAAGASSPRAPELAKTTHAVIVQTSRSRLNMVSPQFVPVMSRIAASSK